MGKGAYQFPADWWRFLPVIRQHRVACGSKNAPAEYCSSSKTVPDGKGFPEQRIDYLGEEEGNPGFRLQSH